MNGEITIENGLGFKLSSDNLKLLAVVQPCTDKIEMTTQIIKQRLELTNFADLFINDFLISELNHRYKNATAESFEFEIGERLDATCEIWISEDKMKAYLSLTPNFGGKAITLENIQKLLQDKKVLFGVVPTQEIEETLKKGRVSNFVIAQGLEPIDGVDTKFVSLTPQATARRPLVDPDGTINYRELGDLIMVHKDDAVMQRIPPIKGKTGKNVLYDIVQPQGGLDIPFSSDQRGVYLNPEDKNQLLAAITGQPILVPNGMIVSPILTIKNVDLASGNIRFEGSVVVLGDVEVDMKVYALEDITIDGHVTNAKIECKGNLTIKGGVTGNSELIAGGDINIKGGIQGYSEQELKELNKKIAPPAKTETPVKEVVVKENSRVTKVAARGSICIGFVENFHVEAGIDIVIDQYSINSELMAANNIVIGSKGGRKPSIIGGTTWAMMIVKAAVIGSSTGIKTRVQAGSNPYIQRRALEIKNILLQSEDERQNIHKILAWMTNNPEKNNPEMVERLHHTLSRLSIDAEMYKSELNELT